MSIREYCTYHVKHHSDPLLAGFALAHELGVHIDDLVCMAVLEKRLG